MKQKAASWTHLQESITKTTSLMVMLVSAILVDKITYKNRKCEVTLFGLKRLIMPSKISNRIYLKSQQYVPQKPKRTVPREGSLLWLPQEAQDQTLYAAPPEESGNAEVKSCTGGLLQQEYKKVGYYYVNLISSFHNIKLSGHSLSQQINPLKPLIQVPSSHTGFLGKRCNITKQLLVPKRGFISRCFCIV